MIQHLCELKVFVMLFRIFYSTFEQADLQKGIFRPGEVGCPPPAASGCSRIPTSSQRFLLHAGTESQTPVVLHP